MKEFETDVSNVVYVKKNEDILLVPPMILTTILLCALIAYLPQLMPLWMATPKTTSFWKELFSRDCE